ncbi:hypothetical protein [Microvirga makkahensis]|uniref:Uncharacterized protein n=1 Tax=Microvirga makkahensis TaxID=1128670 RepID=A0A7X3MNH4_9HYPH|nr:hypothetical protein [Microvirga makkahensis]MXQ10336.1 hypothetical protein [Microvirga makkahensis]
MTPRNPEDSSKSDVESRSLQDLHDPLDGRSRAAAAPEPDSPPVPALRQEESVEAKLTLDRLEAYMKGPTVFSA